MRRPGGWLLIVVGLVIALGGAAVALLFGPDNRAETGPHRLSSAGVAITTAPAALTYSGPTVEVTAETAGRTVFVGLAHDVDVRDYLANTAYTRIDAIDLPWSIRTTEVKGERSLPVLPADADFWLASTSGDGSASLRFPLPDAAVDVVVMDADGGANLVADVTVAVVHDGAFLNGLAVLVVGAGAAAGGVLLLRHAPRRGRRRGPRKRPPLPRPGRRRRERDKAVVGT